MGHEGISDRAHFTIAQPSELHRRKDNRQYKFIQIKQNFLLARLADKIWLRNHWTQECNIFSSAVCQQQENGTLMSSDYLKCIIFQCQVLWLWTAKLQEITLLLCGHKYKHILCVKCIRTTPLERHRPYQMLNNLSNRRIPAENLNYNLNDKAEKQ